MSQCLDGQTHFGCTLERFPDHPLNAQGLTMRRVMASRKLDVPPLSKVADVEPLPAWIQQDMLVVSCPDCVDTPEGQPHFVWREGPYLFLCTICGNASAGYAHRPVALPDNLAEIEAALACRPQGNRSWIVGESVEELLAENRRYGWAPSSESEAA